MSIWDKMNDLTKGKVEKLEIESVKSKIAKTGDVIRGTINNLVVSSDKKKGGYGFISSPELPFERIFFHWTGLKQDTLRFPELTKRMKVEFQLQHDDTNGYRAIKISVAEI